MGTQLAEWWREVQSGSDAHRGALWAAICAASVAVLIGGLTLKSGFGRWVDLLFVACVALVALPLVTFTVALALKFLRRLPPLAVGILVSVVAVTAWPWLNALGFVMSALLLVVECTLGACVATVLFGGLRYAALSKKILTVGSGAVAVAANVALLAFLHSDGIAEPVSQRAQTTNQLPEISNPAQPGPYVVKTLSYGSGDDRRRAEYSRSVAFRTLAVDGTPMLSEFGGWKANVRKRYWGFGVDRLPLNARVWYPAGNGPFPLVLMVHGNHEMSEPSEAGYAYLGELLASRGFIFASIDENFLNIGLFHQLPAEQPLRAWLMLEHLKRWRQWNATPGQPFFGKVDLNNVALMGHSRGGEAAATAALFNKLAYDPDDAAIRFQYNFGIKAVVAIAPADGQYQPAGQARILTDVNYLTMQGANDADVSSFEGSRQWDHVRFTGTGDFFKTELYVYGANHSQFNSVWGRCDASGPKGWFLNLRPLLSAAEQQSVAKLYIAAFLEATLHGRFEYRALLRDYRRAASWLPDTLYLDRYLDSSNKVLADFSEDADLTTTTWPGGKLAGRNLATWCEGKIPFRQGDRGYNGVFLGWNGTKPAATYSVVLPAGSPITSDSVVTLSLAVTGESSEEDGMTDISVSMADGNRQVTLPLSRFRNLASPVPVRFTKLEYLDRLLYKEPIEPVFQSVELPVRDFGVDPARLQRVDLIFDRSPAGEIVISQIGIARHLRE